MKNYIEYLPLTIGVAFLIVQLIATLTGFHLIIPTIILGSLIGIFFLFFCATACGIALSFIIIAISNILKPLVR